MQSKITNNYNIADKRPKLSCDMITIFEPQKGWSFAHCSAITYFNDRFYIMFNNGRINEDDVGQRIMYSFSDDLLNWSSPKPLIDSKKGGSHEVVLNAGGFYVNDNNALVAYYTQYEYEDCHIEDGHRKKGNKHHKNNSFNCIISKDGQKWSKPIKISEKFCSNHGPKKLQSGRLLISGNCYHPYTDNPDGINDWKISSNIFSNKTDLPYCDDSDGISKIAKAHDFPLTLCEGSFLQLDDGTINMMLRSGGDYLWYTTSKDDGKTWSLPSPTKFTDNRTKFNFGRLPNGRYYYIGTPDPFPPRTRHVLVLSTSDDGLNFDRHYILQDKQFKKQFIGLDKNGIYGYPSSIVVDGYLYITVSICKEKIVAMRIACDTL